MQNSNLESRLKAWAIRLNQIGSDTRRGPRTRPSSRQASDMGPRRAAVSGGLAVRRKGSQPTTAGASAAIWCDFPTHCGPRCRAVLWRWMLCWWAFCFYTTAPTGRRLVFFLSSGLFSSAWDGYGSGSATGAQHGARAPRTAERGLCAAGPLFRCHRATTTPPGRRVGGIFLFARHGAGQVLGVEPGGRMAWGIVSASTFA